MHAASLTGFVRPTRPSTLLLPQTVYQILLAIAQKDGAPSLPEGVSDECRDFLMLCLKL